MTIEPVPSNDLNTRFVGILWGEVKCGKTTFAMTLPGRKLLINFDPDGYMSVADRDDFDIIDLSNEAPRDSIKKAQAVSAFLKENPDKYQSIIVDSVTTLMFKGLQNAVEDGVGKSSKFVPTMDAPGLSAYGGRNNRINDVIDRILRVTSKNNQHVFFLAHLDDPEYDKDGKFIIKQTIMLSSKVRSLLGIKVSEIYFMENVKGKRTLYLQPYGVREPMGSRIFDTKLVPKFELKYDPYKPDEEQPDTLAAIFKAWDTNGRKKLVQQPR